MLHRGQCSPWPLRQMSILAYGSSNWSCLRVYGNEDNLYVPEHLLTKGALTAKTHMPAFEGEGDSRAWVLLHVVKVRAQARDLKRHAVRT